MYITLPKFYEVCLKSQLLFWFEYANNVVDNLN